MYIVLLKIVHRNLIIATENPAFLLFSELHGSSNF